ncbi:hypothetical protein CRG98_015888 [Punica granatum]|uniref:DUF4283 domain-containing protein n=1 Tax=Punica granatum TaxID=22663 RepID=A0A2I0K582_PUNGR|nr:hypothetical protein CRG98_015888 [Punica granatum]
MSAPPYFPFLLPFLPPSLLELSYFSQRLRSLWKPGGDMSRVDLGYGFFLVTFSSREDLGRVIRDGTWLVGRQFLTMRYVRASLQAFYIYFPCCGSMGPAARATSRVLLRENSPEGGRPGINQIWFDRGVIGHPHTKYPEKLPVPSATSGNTSDTLSSSDSSDNETNNPRPWMLVSNRQRSKLPNRRTQNIYSPRTHWVSTSYSRTRGWLTINHRELLVIEERIIEVRLGFPRINGSHHHSAEAILAVHLLSQKEALAGPGRSVAEYLLQMREGEVETYLSVNPMPNLFNTPHVPMNSGMNNEINWTLDHATNTTDSGIFHMNILVWNCRGSGSREFCRSMMDLIHQHGPDIIIILTETRLSGDRAQQIAGTFPFYGFACAPTRGLLGGIWMLWRTERVQVDLLESTEQEIHAIIQVSSSSFSWLLSSIFASPRLKERKILWANLRKNQLFICFEIATLPPLFVKACPYRVRSPPPLRTPYESGCV